MGDKQLSPAGVPSTAMAERLALALERLNKSKGSELDKCIELLERAAGESESVAQEQSTSTLTPGGRSKLAHR